MVERGVPCPPKSKRHLKWDAVLPGQDSVALGQHPRQRLLQAAGQAPAKNARNSERLCPSRSSSSPHSENRIFPVQGSLRPSPLWENRRACGGHRSCPGVGTRCRRAWGAGTTGGTQWVWAGQGFVEDLLCTPCFIHRYQLNHTNSARFSFPGEETETRRSQGTCLRVPAGKWQRQTWSKPV